MSLGCTIMSPRQSVTPCSENIRVQGAQEV
jgi:hypothetical protein